ncbi:hypothetical protein MVI27_11290 [Chryseobacterium salipaludis]|uniref:hypothetical protein n=1 Tax=Chryseobacterium TaxID=59732 RepID=UPI001FF0E309|nr:MULTISPECIES: hypothetical protein [Chryseobacterium]MCJ8498833.1 hypothetical protein [Chryseobacterium salipaludis]MCX3297771.1 hypothetical protein [Planobacterium sp. JC490]
MKNTILLYFIFLSGVAWSQTVKVTNSFGSSNPEIQELMDFQKIYVEKFNLESTDLAGKNWEIYVSEYLDGKLTDKILLGETSKADFLKIKYSPFSIKFFTQIKAGTLTINAKFYNFTIKTLHLKLSGKSKEDDYVLKDFFGSKLTMEVPMAEEIPLLAIITPTRHKDGSGSYCEVVQSDIKPEELGKHFNIPHYFLVTMKIK